MPAQSARNAVQATFSSGTREAHQGMRVALQCQAPAARTFLPEQPSRRWGVAPQRVSLQNFDNSGRTSGHATLQVPPGPTSTPRGLPAHSKMGQLEGRSGGSSPRPRPRDRPRCGARAARIGRTERPGNEASARIPRREMRLVRLSMICGHHLVMRSTMTYGVSRAHGHPSPPHRPPGRHEARRA